jgi:hypothetical protein
MFSDWHEGQITFSPNESNLFPQSLHPYLTTSIFSISKSKSPPPTLHITITSFAFIHTQFLYNNYYKIKIGDKYQHGDRRVRRIGEEDKSKGFEGRSEEERDKDCVREENRYCQTTAEGSTGRT